MHLFLWNGLSNVRFVQLFVLRWGVRSWHSGEWPWLHKFQKWKSVTSVEICVGLRHASLNDDKTFAVHQSDALCFWRETTQLPSDSYSSEKLRMYASSMHILFCLKFRKVACLWEHCRFDCKDFLAWLSHLMFFFAILRTLLRFDWNLVFWRVTYDFIVICNYVQGWYRVAVLSWAKRRCSFL